ncbi:hypothetical protein ACWCQH_22985, partial [Streptomyces sp. NPDC002067]
MRRDRSDGPEGGRRASRPAARRTATALAAGALLLPLVSATGPAGAAEPAADSLQRAFTEAAARYHVPSSVLLGVAYLESRWDAHGGAPSVDGGYGPMHLTDARAAVARTVRSPRRDSGRSHTGTAACVAAISAETWSRSTAP